MSKLLAAWKTLSLPSQVAIGVGILVVLALLLGGTNWLTARFERRAFEKELKVEKELRQKDIERADKAEQRAITAESERSKYEIAIALAGAKAEQAMEKVNEAETKFNEEAQSIDTPVPECERYNRIRKKLNLPSVECSATQ